MGFVGALDGVLAGLSHTLRNAELAPLFAFSGANAREARSLYEFSRGAVMFAYRLHPSMRAATVALTEGLETRGFASVVVAGLKRNLTEEVFPPKRRKKGDPDPFEQIEPIPPEDSEVWARVEAFCRTLCQVLNHPTEVTTENADTRYSYEEQPSLVSLHLSNAVTREEGTSSEPAGYIFKVQRREDVVGRSAFAEVFVFPDDAERIRPALNKTIHSMIE